MTKLYITEPNYDALYFNFIVPLNCQFLSVFEDELRRKN